MKKIVNFLALFAQMLTIVAAVASAPPAAGQGRALSKPGTVVEAETLVHRAKATAGSVGSQDMRGFGSQWSGGSQLFWRPPAPVDVPIRSWPSLTLPLDVPQAGSYDVALYFTKAPDYGRVRVFLRGKAVGDVNGWSGGVGLTKLVAGVQKLDAGSNQLVLTVFGKDPASSNFFVGLDRIVVQPIAAASGAASSESVAGQGAAGDGVAGVVAGAVLASLPGPMSRQRQQQLLVQGGSAPGSQPQEMLILTAAKPYAQGAARLSLKDAQLFAPPDDIVINGLAGGQAHATLVTKPGQFFIVNFVVLTSSGGALFGESSSGSVPFRVEVASDDAQIQSQSILVKSDSEWHDVPVVFKAVADETRIGLKRDRPGMWHLGRVEIAAAM